MLPLHTGPLSSILGVLVLCLLAVPSTTATNTAPPNAAYVDTVNQADVYLQELADARLVSGTIAVQKGGQLVYSNAFGWASEVRPALRQLLYLLWDALTTLRRRSLPDHGSGPRLPVMTHSAAGRMIRKLCCDIGASNCLCKAVKLRTGLPAQVIITEEALLIGLFELFMACAGAWSSHEG